MPCAFGRRAFLQTALAAAGATVVRPATAERVDGATTMTPLVDTHLHLWDLKRFKLPWLAGAPNVINRTFLLDDFRAAAEGLDVVKALYMEVDVHPAQQIQEAEFAIGLCENPRNMMVGAVIGGYPHEPSFAEQLKRFAGVKCVKGMRMVLHGDRPAQLCLKPEFVDSMKRLGDAGLTFDLCLRPGELLDGANLAVQCPDTTFVLDHCGNIGVRPDGAVRSVWREGIKAMAGQPNIVCKVSGFIDKAGGTDWEVDSLAENINFCLDAFGEERVLFGGDWPVCLIGGSYRRWVEALCTIVQNRSDEFRRKLFHDNAIRVYRLP
jgi:L-fuconolactonase